MTPGAALLIAAHATVLFVFGAVLLNTMRSAAAASRRLVCVLTLAGASIASILAIFAPRWLTIGTMAPRIVVSAGALARIDGGGARGWVSLCAYAWALVAAALVIRMLGGWAVLRLDLRRAVALQDNAWLHDAEQVARRLGLDAAPQLRMADVGSPMICGAIRPVLLLPEMALEWDAEHRRMVLVHEFAHAMRFDAWANCLAQVVRAVFWWHPLAWYISARLAREQELACDDEVLRAGVPAPSYADALIDAVRGLQSAALFGCAMTGSSGGRMLRDRIEHMLDERRIRMGSARRHGLVIAAFAAMLIITGALRPVWSQSGKVYKIGDGVAAPQVLQKVEPAYTQDARDRKVEGTVVLFVVISDGGEATDIEVTRHLDPGLEENAVSAVRQWRFKPATKDGQPVAVQAHIEINFRLN